MLIQLVFEFTDIVQPYTFNLLNNMMDEVVLVLNWNVVILSKVEEENLNFSRIAVY